MARPKLFPLLLLFQTLGCGHCARGTLTDGEKLMAQKEAIENWEEFSEANNVTGWDGLGPVCGWTGVLCSTEGAVTELNLSCTNGTEGFCATPAVGTMAAELAAIKTLEGLFLEGQAFSGPLPPFWGRRGTFQQLMVLDLSNNNLTGTIPASWAGPEAFPALDALHLSGNSLCGEVPPSLQLKLVCGPNAAEECVEGELPACLAPFETRDSSDDDEDGGKAKGEQEKQEEGGGEPQCAQPEQLPDIPSWAKELNPWIEKKEDARDQLEKNKGIVEEANSEGTRYDFVMYGDSITWRADLNPDVWKEHFGSLPGPSAPLGVIFNQVSDLAYRITTGDELFTLPPKVVVLLIGVNNIERGPQPAEHLDGLVKWLQGAYPGTHLIILNLLPASVDVFLDIDGTNAKYKRVAEENGVAFSTCGSDIDPTDRSQLYDGIHPAAEGLEVLFSCLGPQVAEAVAAWPCT